MNVLIFVMTLLMLLALMTYARLETYRSSQVFQVIFKHYMENDERGYFNSQADSVYNTIHVFTKKAGDGKSGPKAEGSPRIGISLLIDKDKREKNSEGWQQTKTLLKNLFDILYSDQPFYIAALENNPSLPDELIDAMIRAIDELPKEKKLKTAADLANLRLDNLTLDTFLYKILQGAIYLDITPKKADQNKKLELKQEILIEEMQEDKPQEDRSTETEENEAEEFKSIEGYYSVLDFVTTQSGPKVRVFLAPKEVLQTVFPKGVVENILNERRQYYQRVVNREDPKVLSEEFKAQFERYKDSTTLDSTLNFTVTQTNPKKYERNDKTPP